MTRNDRVDGVGSRQPQKPPRARPGSIAYLTLAIAALYILASAANVSAATRHVSNYGIDGGTCGLKVNPCRSISQGIANAAVGDTILVGPGIYGDVDNDDDHDPGDEPLGKIQINKRVTVLSSHGSSATVIRSGASRQVEISASLAVFGKKNQGFTVIGSGDYRVLISGNLDPVSVGGNVLRGFEIGIEASGPAILRDNRAIGLDTGFDVLFPTGLVRLEGNLARNCGAGFAALLANGSVAPVMTKNAAIGNQIGFAFLEYFATEVFSIELTGNTVVGNVETGVSVASTADMSVSLGKNNFFGNGTDGSNCGIKALAGFSSVSVNAADNYWGGPAPGADPADEVCIVSGSVTVTTSPSATKEFGTKPKPIR